MPKYVLLLIAAILPYSAVSALWVAHEFIGGPKCTPSGPISFYQAPGFEAEKAKLRRAKIKTLREYFRDHATCEACHTCPNYHREIFFEIAEDQLEKSAALGYRKAPTPPSSEDLDEYERSKVFKPKPDLPLRDE